MISPFSVDKKYVDQHGVDYLYIGFHPARTTHPFVFTRQDGVGVFFSDENGNILWSDNKTLREVKPKITRWVNVYNSRFSEVYENEKAAKKCGVQPMARIKIEFEEGEGL